MFIERKIPVCTIEIVNKHFNSKSEQLKCVISLVVMVIHTVSNIQMRSKLAMCLITAFFSTP